MAVVDVANNAQPRTAARQLLIGAIPAAVGYAAAVLLLTVGALLAGPTILREHANGATLALLGMGVPAHWAALSGKVAGTIGISQYPALLVATAIVAAATLAVGWFAARRDPASSTVRLAARNGAWFAAFSAMAAVAASHGKPLTISGFTVDVAISLPLTMLLSATWAFIGSGAGALLARRVRAAKTQPRLSPWIVRAPGTAMVATAVTIMGLSACGTSPNAAVAAVRPPADALAAPTPTTTVAPTTTTAPVAAATHSTTARAKRSTSTGAAAGPAGTTGGASAAGGFAPATPGTYRYDTSGSTSSLLGKQTFPAVSTLTVDAPTGTRQHSTRQLLSGNGDGFIIEQVLDYQPQGVAVVQQRLTMIQGGKKSVKTLNASPAGLVIPLTTAIGSHGVLDLTGSGISGHEVVDLVQAVTVAVAGQPVSGVLVRSVLTVAGSVSGTIQLDQWWTPSVRVPMKEQLSGTMKSGFVTVKTNYTATLQKLTP